MITRLARRQERWSVYERLAERAGLDLPPPQLWLLARLGERLPLPVERLPEEVGGDPEHMVAALEGLRRRRLVPAGDGAIVRFTEDGRAVHAWLVAARREALDRPATGWRSDDRAELDRLLDRLAHEFVREMPRT
jgi:hypothetical protein